MLRYVNNTVDKPWYRYPTQPPIHVIEAMLNFYCNLYLTVCEHCHFETSLPDFSQYFTPLTLFRKSRKARLSVNLKIRQWWQGAHLRAADRTKKKPTQLMLTYWWCWILIQSALALHHANATRSKHSSIFDVLTCFSAEYTHPMSGGDARTLCEGARAHGTWVYDDGSHPQAKDCKTPSHICVHIWKSLGACA